MIGKALLSSGFLAALLIELSTSMVSAQGYRLENQAIHIDRPEHWRAWIYQNDVVTSLNMPVEDSGLFQTTAAGIQPRPMRSRTNAALDAESFIYSDIVREKGKFIYGGASSPTNDRIATRAIDGDLSTYWEPDRAAFNAEGLRSWELTVDLGRLTFADSITVVLPSGQLAEGDPPKAFTLYASLGEAFPFPAGSKLSFVQLAQVTESDLVARSGEMEYLQYTFRLQPLLSADFNLDGHPDISGTFLQHVRLRITDSDLDRDRFIGAGDSARVAYEDLPPARRGAVVYQRWTAGENLIETDRQTYFEEVDPDERGPIRYFAGEVPRVLEVEIWDKGDNLAYGPERRAGGSYEMGGRGTPGKATDGLYQTEWTAWGWDQLIERGTMWLDLGATFWVTGVYSVMQRAADHRDAFMGHEFLVSDGTQIVPVSMATVQDFGKLEHALKWDNIISENQVDNRTPRVMMFSETFAPRKIRFMQLRNISVVGGRVGGVGARLAEIQLYGKGYPVDVWLYSPPIQLVDDRGNFVRKTMPRITWGADAILLESDPTTGEQVERIEPLEYASEVRLQVETRTSDQTDTNWTYYEVVEIEGAEEKREVVEDAYDALVLEQRAWAYWQTLPTDRRHASRTDDDEDGATDEDPIDFVDNDGDGLVDEDGKKLRRAPRTRPEREGELALVGWSEWSPVGSTNAAGSSSITSPNPRRFLQIRTNILSEDPFKTARLRFLRVDLTPPRALEVVAELALLSDQGIQRNMGDLTADPADYLLPRALDPLRPQQFAYFIRMDRPDMEDPEARRGVDELLVVAPQAVHLRQVRVGEARIEKQTSDQDRSTVSTRAVATQFDQSFRKTEDGWRNDTGQLLELLSPAGSDSLYLRFPFPLNTDLNPSAHALVELQFESQVFLQRIAFAGFVRGSDGSSPVFQSVQAEDRDATELTDSGTVRPSLEISGQRMIQKVEIPRVFTPNGDGINDELHGRFVLLRVLDVRPLEISFHDLAGNRCGQARWLTGTDLGQTAGQAGEFRFSWDGRNAAGTLMPPGAYLCRVRIEADAGPEETVRAVYVVY